MNWKWGGPMNNKGKCIYYVEGPCEQQLIAALKESPSRNQVVSRLQQLYSMFKSSNWAKRSKNNPVIKPYIEAAPGDSRNVRKDKMAYPKDNRKG